MVLQTVPYFLKDGGEMGEMMRSFNWANTSIGAPETWPHSLKTMVAVMLNNPFAMSIIWGDDYTQLYNDGYRPALGSNKHPKALGASCKDNFAEVWDVLGPMFKKVKNGSSVQYHDFKLILNRNDYEEACYFDFAYSPIKDDEGFIGGVLITVLETTSKKNSEQKLLESEEKFRTMADNIPNLAWMADADGWIYWYNKQWYEFTGTTAEQMEGWGWQKVHHPSTMDAVTEKWKSSIESGEDFEMIFPLKGADGNFRQFLTRVLSVKDETGKIYQWFGTNTDITQQKNIETELRESKEKFHQTVKQAPVGIAILRGSDYRVELANDAYLLLAEKTSVNFLNKPLFESMPEVAETVKPLLDNVMISGVAYRGSEYKIPLKRNGIIDDLYFDFLYSPLIEKDGTISGIIVTVTEVTDSVNAKFFVTESEKQFRKMVMDSPVAMAIFRGPNNVVEMANLKMCNDIWQKKEEEVIGKEILKVFPELNDQKYPKLLSDVYVNKKIYKEVESLALVQWNDQLKKFYLDFEYAPLFEKDGTVSAIMITVNDVTEKVETRLKIEESELFNRTILESSPDCVKVLDKEGKITFMNINGVCILEGENKEFFINKQWQSLWSNDNKAIIDDAVQKALHGKLVHFQAPADTAKGTPKWWDVIVAPIFDTERNIVNILATSRDITDEKQHEQALKDSEKSFRSLAESLPQLVWQADANGNNKYASAKWTEFTGLPFGKEVWKATVHPDDFENISATWRNSIKEEIIFEADVRLKNKEGAYRWHRVKGVPVYDKDKKLMHWVGAYNDIQNEKEFTAELESKIHLRTTELEKTNIELQKMNKELESFAYISSHDLQEPLRKIQTFSSQILEKETNNLSEDGLDRFRRMQNAANRMRTLIEDLLAYSRTSTVAKKYESVNLSKLIESVKDDLKEELEQYNAKITYNTVCNLNIIPFQVKQLLHNLISNSIKFSKKGVAPVIDIACNVAFGSTFKEPKLQSDISYCHITITDNGIGFEQEYAERIFEVFQRLHGKAQYNGTGIGLAIVKKIVENHNGYISALSKINEGTIFNIYIPENQNELNAVS